MQPTRWIKPLMILMMAVSNAGCAYDLNNRGNLSCPPLVEYSQETQHKAADEIRAGKARTLAALVKDYGVLRKACRI